MSCPLFEQREKSSLPEIITSRLPKRVYQGVKSPPETESACLESVRWTPDPYFRYFSKSGIFKMAPKTAGWIQLKEKYSQNSARTQKIEQTTYLTDQGIPPNKIYQPVGVVKALEIFFLQKFEELRKNTTFHFHFQVIAHQSHCRKVRGYAAMLHSILSIMLCVIGYSCGMTVFICTSIQKQRLLAMDDHLIKPLKVCISYQCNVDLDQCFEWIFMSRGDNDCCTAKCLPLKSGRITQSLNQKN